MSVRNLVWVREDHGLSNFRGTELERRRFELDMWSWCFGTRVLGVVTGGSSRNALGGQASSEFL